MATAYVLINCELGSEEAVISELKSIEGVVEVHGTFGVCFVDAKNPNVLVGARHGSPLILGIGENEQEFFLASDAAAIVEYTRQVVYLEEGDIVTITRSDDGKMKYEISSLHSSRASYDSAMFDALMQLAE